MESIALLPSASPRLQLYASLLCAALPSMSSAVAGDTTNATQPDMSPSGLAVLQEAVKLDDAKLRGPGGPTHLIIYLDGVQVSLESAEDPEDVLEVSATLKNTLQRLWAPVTSEEHLDTAYLCAGIQCRNIICRIYTAMFLKLNGAGLFDAANTWLNLALTTATRSEIRITALHVYAGVLLTKLGEMIPSLALQHLMSLIRIFRDKSLTYRLRYAASRAVASSLATSGQSLSISDARDAFKTLRPCLAHESGIIQRGAAECLGRLFSACYALQTMSDIDQVLQVSFKAQESADWRSRQQHVDLCSTLLLLTQVPRSMDAASSAHNGPPSREGESQATLQATSGQAAKGQESKTLLTVNGMIARLAGAYNKSGATSKGRTSAMQIMSNLFIRLEAPYLCDNFPAIWDALLEGFINGVYASGSRQNLDMTEEYLTFVIGKVLFDYLFHEEEQLIILRYLSDQLGSLPETPRTHLAHTVQRTALRMSRLLLHCFGQSTNPEILQLEKPLLSLTRHLNPNSKVVASCLSAFAWATPTRLPVLATELLSGLETILHLQGNFDGTQEDYLQSLLSQASALSSLVPLLRQHRVYASEDICARLVSLAAAILKQAGDRDLSISEAMINCAWTLYSSLLTLQAAHVTVHLPQILLLWRNALPRPSPRDVPQAVERTLQDWTFLFSIRAAALSSMVSFLENREKNDEEGDVLRRIIALLNHGVLFEASAPPTSCFIEDAGHHTGTLKLDTCRTTFMRHLLEAFALVPMTQYSAANRTALSDLCLVQVSRCRSQTGHQQLGSGRDSISSPIWEFGDALPAFARNDAAFSFDAYSPSFNIGVSLATKEYVLEALPRRFRNDGGELPLNLQGDSRHVAVKGSVTLIDRAGRLLAALFPFLAYTKQLIILGVLTEHAGDSTGLGRLTKQTSVERVTDLSLLTLIAMNLEEARKDMPALEGTVLSKLSEALTDGLTSPDAIVRHTSCRGIASLSVVGPSTFLSTRIQAAVAMIVTDTQPYARAGYIQLLAEMYKSAGAIAARPALKTLVDIAMTLVQDPHPIVHYWSLRSLALIIETAGLDFTPYVTSCLVMISKIISSESHDPEGGTLGTSLLRGDLPVRQAMSAVVDQIIVAAGPALCEELVTSRATLALVRSFFLDNDVRVVVQAGSALQHLLLVLPGRKLDVALTQIPINQLFSPNLQVQTSAVNTIYQIVRRDAQTMSKVAGDKLVDRLFTILDADPSTDGVKQTIWTWMIQTADTNAAGWLAICQRVLSQGMSNWQVLDTLPHKLIVEDEEAQGLGFVAGDNERDRSHMARWQTRKFALFCVTCLVRHLQPATSKNIDDNRANVGLLAVRKLYGKMSDLVRLALLSSTSVNVDIKIGGLGLLKAIIIHAKDMHFDGAPLLEQYQASIIAAAGPAFEPDSEPEFHVAAIKLCGYFVAAQSSGELGNMKRAVKHLERTLNGVKEPPNLSPMTIPVQVACGAAWARIYIISQARPALSEIVRANWEDLMRLWSALLLESEPPEAGEYPLLVGTDDTEAAQALSMDLESWLLIFSACTAMAMQSGRQSGLASHCSTLLGDLCYYINRYLLAENIHAASESVAALMLECLIGLLDLIKSQRNTNLSTKTWDELVQVSLRLNLLANSTVDRYLPRLLAILATMLPKEALPSQTEKRLLSCYRLDLVVMRRNLELDVIQGTDLAARAWQASLVMSKVMRSTDGSLALPWAILHDHIRTANCFELPAHLLQSARMAAEHMITRESQKDLRLLDQILSAFVLGLQSSLGQAGARAIPRARGYLSILTILSRAALDSKIPLSKPVIGDLCRCTEQALLNSDTGVVAGGLALAKTLSFTEGPQNLVAPLAVAQITSQMIALVGKLLTLPSKETLPSVVLFQLTNGIGQSNEYTRALFLDVYMWLLSGSTAATGHTPGLSEAISSLALRYPLAFKKAYMASSPARRNALQALLKQTSKEGQAASRNDEAAPSIELKSFS